MIARIVFPLPLLRDFSYKIPNDMRELIHPYIRVRVSLKGRQLTGYVITIEEGEEKNLKEIEEIVDPFPILDESIVKILHFASLYYITPLGLAFKYGLSPRLNLDKYLLLKTGSSFLPLEEAFRDLGKTAVFRMLKQGKANLYDAITLKRFTSIGKTIIGRCEKILFMGDVESRTGYYKNLISQCLEAGKNVLFLTPDFPHIGNFFYRSLTNTFPGRVLLFGSHMKERERMNTFFRARCEKGIVILGQITSIFLPIVENSLIIMERHEEEDYRNEKDFKFHTLDLAIRRAEIEGAKIVLGSLSPASKIYKKALEGEFRLEKGEFPKSKVFFVKSYVKQDSLLRTMKTIVEQGLKKGDVIGIFVYRKAYAGHLFCHLCNKAILCPLCDRSLVYRKDEGTLSCPICEKTQRYNGRCPYCGKNMLSISDFGIEYVEEKLRNLFPQVRLWRIENEKDLRNISDKGIVIGTHIISRLLELRIKRLIFILSDGLFKAYGYMSREAVFQLFWNTIDAVRPVEVFLLREKGKGVAFDVNTEYFYQNELEERKKASFPPFARLFSIEVKGKYERVEQEVKGMERKINALGLTSYIVGPLLEKEGIFKWRVILKDVPFEKYRELMQLRDLPFVRIIADPKDI